MKSILLLLFMTLISCAPPAEEGSRTAVKISFPSAMTQSGLRHYKPKGQFGLSDMTSLADIDCYAIVYESSGPSPGECLDTSGVPVANAIEVHGSFNAGSTVEIEVAQGVGMTFHLIGFGYSGGTTCPDYKTFPLAAQTASTKGKLLASVTKDVQGEEITVEMVRDFTGPTISTCQNSPFNWEGSGNAIWDVALWDQASWGP